MRRRSIRPSSRGRPWRSTLGAGLAGAQVQVDPGLPAYKAVSGVSGNISSVGSDTLNNLMTLWAETFSKFYPNAKIQIEGKGSSTAPPALIAGTAQLGPMSREMKGTEIDAVREEVRLQADADPDLASTRSPCSSTRTTRIKCLTLAQVDAVFSKSRRAGRQGGRQDLGPARPHRRVGAASPSASTAATRPPAPTASSRSTCSRTATTRTR